MHMKVGIDLGTTYSTMAVFNEKTSKAEILPNRYGTNLTPSVICFMDDGTTLIGEDAKSMQMDGVGTIASVFKNGMGTKKTYVKADGKDYTAEDLSAMLLRQMVDDVESERGEKIESAVITVPAYFNDLQRTSVTDAARKAGIDVEKIVNEPTAAAVHYGYRRSDSGTLMVYDLGGGTFDVTVVDIVEGRFTVVGTDGDHSLGGVHWDRALMDLVCDRFTNEFGCNPLKERHSYNTIAASAESLKIMLSRTQRARMKVSFRGYTGTYLVTREDFERSTEHLLGSTGEVIDRLLGNIDRDVKDIDEVLLCGGATCMPQVMAYLRGKGFRSVKAHGDVSEAVAKGAAMIACLDGKGKTVTDVAPHSLGILYIDPRTGRYTNKVLIKRNTTIPITVKDRFLIEKGNMTDRVELFTLQGESRNPMRCVPVRRDTITGFINRGEGVEIDLEYAYTNEGRTSLKARYGERRLKVTREELPDDTSWMGKPPSGTKLTRDTRKNVVFCIDLSRSMRPCMDKVADAVKKAVSTLGGPSTKFALVGFADMVETLCGLTYDTDRLSRTLDDMKRARLGRGTDEEPFEAVLDILSDVSGAKIAIVLTDGVWSKKDLAIEESDECRKRNIDVIAVGFGESDESFLHRIATVEGAAMYIQLENLERTINTIATAIDQGRREGWNQD
ncbi:MAG: Hsp70 family protein [archaeon]|nr:Hsp70 family protein [archaeon]